MNEKKPDILRNKKVTTLLLVLIMLLAVGLRFYRLGAYGYGNNYYAAAVESMTQSWHNFFYVAAEPGGSVMVDKPPLGLWIQTVSALIFGVNGFALALPSALAGVFSIFLSYQILKESFGEYAGLSAAFVLAVLPVVVAVDRTNLLDSMVVCTSLCAVYLMLKAVREHQWGWLCLSFFVVALGFNIKMMQAFLVLPALGIVYFFAAKYRWWEKVLHLALATVILLAVSFSWIVIVDLTPEENRPYVSSTESNSMMELVFGHNGLNRLLSFRDQIKLGMTEIQQKPDNRPVGPQQGQTPPQLPQQWKPPADQQNGLPPNAYPNLGGMHSDGAGGRMHDEIGEASWLRLFRQPLATNIAWVLPGGIFLMGISFLMIGFKAEYYLKRTVLWIFSIWLLIELIFFSMADFFHAYYLIMLGVPLAVVIGIGFWALNQLRLEKPWLAFATLAFLLIATTIYQLSLMNSIKEVMPAQTNLLIIGVFCAGFALMIHILKEKPLSWQLVLGVSLTVLVIVPLLWSIIGVWGEDPHQKINYTGAQSYISISYGNLLNESQQKLLDFLVDNSEENQSIGIIHTSSQAAPFVLASGRGVFTTGGFTGGDPVASNEEIIDMLRSGEIFFAFPAFGEDATAKRLQNWLRQNCSFVAFDDVPRPASQDRQPSRPAVVFDCR